MWTQSEATALARQIEQFAPMFGCHIALTGGLLYKDGERKDADFIFYRIRQIPEINVEGLFGALFRIGISAVTDHGFVVKAKYNGQDIDLMFPDRPLTAQNAARGYR